MRKKEDLEIEENGVEGVADVIYFKQTSEFSFSLGCSFDLMRAREVSTSRDWWFRRSYG